jgi:hypothetical protein
MRDWARARRERTRHLIELGGLVQKAGLVELTDDDRATMFGAFLDLANQIRGYGDTPSDSLKIRWRRAGLRAFDAERDAPGKEGEPDHEKRSPDHQMTRHAHPIQPHERQNKDNRIDD